MKKLFFLVALVGLLGLPAVTFAADDVVNTKHNLSNSATVTRTYGLSAGGTNEVCVFCHTPHGGQTGDSGPLWNRQASTLAGTYTVYNSTTLNATAGQPGGVSLACLSCHDGAIAFDALLNNPGSGNTALTGETWLSAKDKIDSTTPWSYLGQDLSNDHPVSIDWTTNADTGLRKPPNAGPIIYAGKVECASCHNPHDSSNGMFLRISNSASALCVACHIK